MKRFTNFIKRHKVVTIIIISFFSIVLLDSIINGDFTDFKNFIKSSIYLAVLLYVLFLMVSRKEYYCNKCNAKLKGKTSTCPNCVVESVNDEKQIVSKRTISKSKILIYIGMDIMLVPIALGLLYIVVAPIFGALSSNSFSISETLLVFYTNESLLPIAISFNLIGLVLIIMGYLFKKKESKKE